jgi:hypothetical protein
LEALAASPDAGFASLVLDVPVDSEPLFPFCE